MGFAALDGSGEEFGVVEDIAGEDVGRMGWFVEMRNAAKRGHVMPCPYEGMKWDGRV